MANNKFILKTDTSKNTSMRSRSRKFQQNVEYSDVNIDVCTTENKNELSGKALLSKQDKRFNPISSNSVTSNASSKLKKIRKEDDSDVQKTVNKLTKISNISRRPVKHSFKNRQGLSRDSKVVTASTSSSDEVPMLVDKEEVVAEVSYCRMHLDDSQTNSNLEQFKDSFDNGEPMDIVDSRIKKMYIVLDTNVLLSDLGLVDDILKKENRSTFPIVYVIPWVVLQELDLLKSDKNKKAKLIPYAIKAISYLHEKFKNCGHQFRGQSAVDVKKGELFKAESNDDRILQCGMNCKRRFDGEVIIFSNDKNMANKALVHSINVCSSADICIYLEKTLSISDGSLEDSAVKTSIALTVGVCETIYRSWTDLVTDLLDYIVKKEMEVAYGGDWRNIIFIKPPWTLKDLLRCIKKHWIAVFGFILKKKALDSLEDLLSNYNINGYGTIKNLKELLHLSYNFISSFEHHSTYNERLPKVLTNISDFKEQLANRDHPVTKKSERTTTTTLVSVDNSSVIKVQSNDLDTVKSAFDFVWNIIRDLCGLILDSFGKNNPIIYNRPVVLPTRLEIEHFFENFLSTVQQLKFYLNRAIDVGVAEESIYVNLCNLLKNFISILGLHGDNRSTENLNPSILKNFIAYPSSRELVQCGLQELDRYMSLVTC